MDGVLRIEEHLELCLDVGYLTCHLFLFQRPWTVPLHTVALAFRYRCSVTKSHHPLWFSRNLGLSHNFDEIFRNVKLKLHLLNRSVGGTCRKQIQVD